MKHTCLLFIGDDFSAVAKGIRKYVLRYGKGQVPDYLAVMQMKEAENGYAILSAEEVGLDDGVFNSDMDSTCLVVMKQEKNVPAGQEDFVKETGAFLNDYFSQRVTLMMPGDGRMSLCIITSPTQANGCVIVENICRAVKQCHLRYDIDVMVYPHTGAVTYEAAPQSDAAAIEETRVATQSMVDHLLRLRNGYPGIFRLITLLQDKNQRGITITFSKANLIRILGEYAIICAENFNAVFPQTVLLNNKDKLCSFGIAQVGFDHHYAVQYLLRQAFIHLLERESANQEDIDVNKVAAVAKECLMRHSQLQSEFYEKYIAPVIAEGRTEQEAITESGGKLDLFMAQVECDLLSFMDSKELSLPEKRCVLALILGEDDNLTKGELFDKDQVALLDYYSETVNMFVEYNNGNLHYLRDDKGQPLMDEAGNYLMDGGVIDKSVDEQGICRFRLDELKRLRLAIRQSASYIRKKEEELAKLDVSQQREEDSGKVVSADGFVFGGEIYQFIPDDPPVPVNETYTPKPVNTDNVNLSVHFSPIRTQGSIGSCSPHAIVAIYEYILRKNGKADCDLSERYVYYNVRRAKGCLDSDQGASLFDVIKSMEEEGVCQETLCPYDLELYNVEPAGEAYDDGRKRRIMKAMNIPIGDSPEKNIEALRSALSEGYPVAVGLRLFDSFGSTKGFVLLPTEDEISSEDKHFHAMVVCGYDDRQKYFLVRNSWGTGFGKDGYCYIPYAYLADNRLLHGAYIVTEVSSEDIRVEGVVGTERFSFNTADNEIKAVVIQNMITEERNKLQHLRREYRDLRFSTEELLQQLATANTRDDIFEESKARLSVNLAAAKGRQEMLTGQRGEQLKEHERQTASTLLRLSGVALALLLINGVWTYNWWSDDPLNIGTHTFVLAAMFVICLLFMLAWYVSRHYSYKHLREDINGNIRTQGESIGRMEKELESMKRKFHVGGMMMDRLSALDHNLNTFYQSARNYVSNLSLWYNEEREKREKMSPQLIPPFGTVIDTDTLDQYFEQCKDTILKDHYLYQFLCDGTYQLGADQIIAFQKKLQQHILDCLNKDIQNFRLHDYFMGLHVYPFLPSVYSGRIKSMLEQMDAYAVPFSQMVNPKKPAAYLFIQRKDAKGDAGPWMDILSERPTVLGTSSPWSMTLLKTVFADKKDFSLLSSEQAMETNKMRLEE